MSENAKNSAADAAAGQKGRAENEEKTPKVDVEQTSEAETASDAPKSAEVTSEPTPKEELRADAGQDAETNEGASDNTNVDTSNTAVVTTTAQSKSGDDKVEKIEIEIEASNKPHPHESFQAEVREQIENCKFELIAELQESIHTEMQQVADTEIRRVNRRRRAGFIIRDIIILLLAVLVGYFGYCLYDIEYFDFLKSDCAQTDCPSNNDEVTVAEEPEVKDTDWYLHNYGYLFDSLKINLDADKVTAYYLYSDDYKVSEIQPEYLLAMAYNRLDDKPTPSHDNNVTVSAEQMRKAFVNLYGSADYFVKQSFTYDCIEFSYNKDNDSFLAPNISCPRTAKRQILEQVDEVYEEGNVIYFLTTATIYDKSEQSFYTFDNLFKPVVTNVSKTDLDKYSSLLNKYQYRFKKVDGVFYFSDVTKLR